MSHKIKTCFALSVAIAAICIPRAQAVALSSPAPNYSGFSRGIEDRKTHQILRLAALNPDSEGDDTQRSRYQFVLLDGEALTPIGPVMEGYPWESVKNEITEKYGKMPQAERDFPRIVAIPGFGLLIAWASVTDGDLGPHFGQMNAWERILAFPIGLGVFAVGIPVGGAIDLFTLGTREPPAAFYALKNGNLVRAFLNVMEFSPEGKEPAKVGRRAFDRLFNIVSSFGGNAVTIDLGAVASPDGFESVVWFGTGDPQSAVVLAQLHCPKDAKDGMLYIMGNDQGYRVFDCRSNLRNLGDHASSGRGRVSVVLSRDSREVIRFVLNH